MKENKESFDVNANIIRNQIQNFNEPEFPDFNSMVTDLLKNELRYGITPPRDMKIFGHVIMPKHK